GILDLTRELRAAAGTAPLVRIAGFWHNSFDAIIGNDPKELTAAVGSQFGSASLTSGLPEDATVESDQDEDEEVVTGTLKVLASIDQGFRLRGDAETLNMERNMEFGGKLIL